MNVPQADSAAQRFRLTGLSHVFRHPRITEKATDLASRGAYVFNVAEDATKREIVQAVRALYSVTPRSVKIVRVPTKVRKSMRTGRVGVKSGGKKAYIYLKRGETISLS